MKITESTTISISLVITFFGGVSWLTALWAKADSNTSRIVELKTQRASDHVLLKRICINQILMSNKLGIPTKPRDCEVGGQE